MSQQFDPQQWLGEYQARADQLYASAMHQQQALASLAADATAGSVTVRVGLGGVLQHCAVSADAGVTAARLGTDFTQAYQEALRLMNAGAAQHSGGVGDQVLGVAADELAGDQPQRVHGDLTVDATGEVPPMPIDQQFDELLALLDGEPDDIASILDSPAYQRYRTPGDPTTWQSQLEQQVRQISQNADQLTQLANTIVGEQDLPELTIQVGTSGRVTHLTFKGQVTRLRPEQIGERVLQAYTEASADAQRLLTEAVADIGLDPGDGPPIGAGRFADPADEADGPTRHD